MNHRSADNVTIDTITCKDCETRESSPEEEDHPVDVPSSSEASQMPPDPCKSTSCASHSADDSGSVQGYLTDVGPNDVIFGRGSTANDNPGNVKFRRLVQSRQADYIAATTRKAKQRVAREVMDHVRLNVDPPGRFLQKVDSATAREKGFAKDQFVWCEADDSLALEKAKQALRRQSNDEFPEPQNADRTTAGSPGSININIGITLNAAETPSVSQAFGYSTTRPLTNNINLAIPINTGGTQNAIHATTHLASGPPQNYIRFVGYGGIPEQSSWGTAPLAGLPAQGQNAMNRDTSTGLPLGHGTYQPEQAKSFHGDWGTHSDPNLIAAFATDPFRDQNDVSSASSTSLLVGPPMGQASNTAMPTQKENGTHHAHALQTSFTTEPFRGCNGTSVNGVLTEQNMWGSAAFEPECFSSGNAASPNINSQFSEACVGGAISCQQSSQGFATFDQKPTYGENPVNPAAIRQCREPCLDQPNKAEFKEYNGRKPSPRPQGTLITESCRGENRTVVNSPCKVQNIDTPQVMTLKDWVASKRTCIMKQSDGKGCLASLVRLAWEIAKPIRDCHAKMLTYNGAMSLHDIEVSCLEPVSFYRINLSATDASDEQKAAQADLASLGRILYELFAGSEPHSDNEEEEDSFSDQPSLEKLSMNEKRPMKRRDPRRSEPTYTPLRDLSLPVSLSILVTSLLDAEDDSAADRYHSAEEAEADLHLMVAKPERYLYDANNKDTILAQLYGSSGKLYGRDEELSILMGAYDRVVCTSKPCEVVLIKGYSGTGKSTLARQLQKPLIERGGYFISGKFDEMSRAQPLSAIVSAFNDYCKDLVSRGDNCLVEIRKEVKNFFGSDRNLLVNLIPNLSKVIGMAEPPSVEVGCVEAMSQLVFFFRMFARAMSKPSRPVILFLDDLQWADEASLEIIRMLATDREVNSLLFLGCYRDNEVGTDHPLLAQQKKLVASGVNVGIINVENISRESVNALISDSLYLPPRLTKDLTKVVYNKTSGNTLFVVQFLASLFDEGFLNFSPMLRRWKWTLHEIQSKNIADNVVDFLRKKMLTLPKDVQNVIRMVAYLGAQSEVSTLKLLGLNNGCEQKSLELLDIAEGNGILYRIGSVYKFSHDQIQLAAYALTPESERDALHFEIGNRLIQAASEEVLEKILFTAVDQLNRGRASIANRKEKINLSTFNLEAAKKAIASSSFLAASDYLMLGIDSLEEEDWDTSYELCLELYNCCAETQYTLGNFDQMKSALNNIFSHAKVFKDKLRASYTLVCSLGANGSLQEAIDTGLEVLSELGESFPKNIDRSVIVQDMMQTKEALGDQSEDVLSNLEVMVDENSIAAMKFLNRLSLYAYTGKQNFVPLIASRLVRLSLTHGVCNESAFGFASYGMVLCISAGKYDEGYRFGKVALKLLEKLQANEHLARVYAVVYGCINIWIEPIQVCPPSHLTAYGVGLMTGDPEYAMMNIQLYLSTSFFSGKTLEKLANECELYSKEMLEYKQEVAVLMIQPMWQLTLNLMGRSKDPLELTGEAMDEEAFLWDAEESGNWNAKSRLYLLRMWLAYLFGKYDLAAIHMENCDNFESKLLGLGLCFHTFTHGLTALALARKTLEKKWVEIANKAIEKFTAWAASAPWNCQHKLELLNAEYAFFIGDTTKAAKAYHDAIDLAGKHSFVSDQALCLERAAIFHSETGDQNSSAECYTKARQCYLQWGAQRKADDIEHLCLPLP